MKGLSFIVILAFLTGACEKKEKGPSIRFPIHVGEVVRRDVPYYVKAIGQFGASIEIDVMAQVEGTLTNVLFDDGTKVDAGQLLMTIDERPYVAELNAAKARLKENQARLSYALDFAETYGKLVGDEFVSRLEFEQGVRDVDTYKAAIEANFAEIEKARINVGYTEIRSPISGYVGLRWYDPGNYVRPDGVTTLVSVLNVKPISLAFSVPSQYAFEVRQRQREKPLVVHAELPSDPANVMEGILTFVDNNVNEDTGMIKLEASFKNEDERAWPGEFGRAYLLLRTIEDAVMAPTEAISLGQEGYFVFVFNSETNTVEMKMVERGIQYKEYTEIKNGLEGNELVVTEGQLNLFPGAPVFLKRPIKLDPEVPQQEKLPESPIQESGDHVQRQVLPPSKYHDVQSLPHEQPPEEGGATIEKQVDPTSKFHDPEATPKDTPPSSSNYKEPLPGDTIEKKVDPPSMFHDSLSTPTDRPEVL